MPSKLLDSYANEFAIVRLDNLVVNNESFILLKAMLQVQGVVGEEQVKKEAF